MLKKMKPVFETVEVMVFAIIKNEHYENEAERGVRIVYAEKFDELAEFGWEAEKWYAKGKFGKEGGRRFKPLKEMRVGTTLKKGGGEYIMRLA